ETRLLGELLDRVPPVEQDARLAVDVRDAAFAARRRGKAGIEREHPALRVQLRDVDYIGAERGLAHRKLERFARIRVGQTQTLTCHPSHLAVANSNYS